MHNVNFFFLPWPLTVVDQEADIWRNIIWLNRRYVSPHDLRAFVIVANYTG